jgi:hypothetical protein
MIEFFSFLKKSNSHKLESFFLGGVQESKILILDPGLDYKGLRYLKRGIITRLFKILTYYLEKNQNTYFNNQIISLFLKYFFT